MQGVDNFSLIQVFKKIGLAKLISKSTLLSIWIDDILGLALSKIS